jgi:hypothetical protein
VGENEGEAATKEERAPLCPPSSGVSRGGGPEHKPGRCVIASVTTRLIVGDGLECPRDEPARGGGHGHGSQLRPRTRERGAEWLDLRKSGHGMEEGARSGGDARSEGGDRERPCGARHRWSKEERGGATGDLRRRPGEPPRYPPSSPSSQRTDLSGEEGGGGGDRMRAVRGGAMARVWSGEWREQDGSSYIPW